MLYVGSRYAYGVRNDLTVVVEVTREVRNYTTSDDYYGRYVVNGKLGKKEIRLDRDRVGCVVGNDDSVVF
jgi:hypothetical protein